ncbi:MAG: hypothetical protein H0U73_03640 [Tatlockia sp.]|nr:hypothetical protein [Tatlockia sp.]
MPTYRGFRRSRHFLFSETIESRYHQQKMDRSYKRDVFVEEVVFQFNQLLEYQITSDEILQHLDSAYPFQQAPEAHEKPVSLSECTPAG